MIYPESRRMIVVEGDRAKSFLSTSMSILLLVQSFTCAERTIRLDRSFDRD
jgi:hypothetical protein